MSNIERPLSAPQYVDAKVRSGSAGSFHGLEDLSFRRD